MVLRLLKKVKGFVQSDVEKKKSELRDKFKENLKQYSEFAEKAYSRTIGKPFDYKGLALAFQDGTQKMTTPYAQKAVEHLSRFFYIKMPDPNKTVNEFQIIIDPVERIKMVEEYERAKDEARAFEKELNMIIVAQEKGKIAKQARKGGVN